uniref:Uncharacterized protein n=1 Tax=Tetradesmus obliquus TaxID=3088 RepID=A0A383VV87_TETOB|eukprot:jgi/Sobl393_1/1027/SZX77615.1
MTAAAAGDAADAGPSTAAGPQSMWRRLTKSLSYSLDAMIDGVLQDGDVLVVVEKPRCFAADEQVLPHTTTFRAHNKVLVPRIRRAFALLCVVGMVVWLLVDVLYQDANGLVPGLRDTYIIDSKPFDPNEQQQQHDSSTTSVCTCTYSAASSAYGLPPYSSLVRNSDHNQPSFKTFLAYCEQLPGGQQLLNNSTAAGRLVIGVLDEFFYHLTAMRIAAPTSAILLPKEGWKAVRMADAQRAAYAALTTAQYKIWSSPENITTNDEVAMGMKHAALLYAAFSTALGRLLEMPDSATTAEAVSQATNVSAPISCPNVPSRDQLPLALGEWCVPAAGQPGRTADTRDNERDCSDPYAAYVQWCAPALCHTLGPKSHYLQAVQIMSAIGGVYSIIAMFAFAIVWRAFCALERQVDLDGLWLTNYSRLTACWPTAADAAHRLRSLHGLGGVNAMPPLPQHSGGVQLGTAAMPLAKPAAGSSASQNV